MDEETWTIEVVPSRFGARACAYSDDDRRLWSTIATFGLSDKVAATRIWRPTAKWARRAVEGYLRQCLRAERRAERAEEQAQVYRFQG